MIGEFIIVHPYAVDCVHWVDELWVREAHPVETCCGRGF